MSAHFGNDKDSQPVPYVQGKGHGGAIILIFVIVLIAIGIGSVYLFPSPSPEPTSTQQQQPAADPERDRLWDLVLDNKACFPPKGGIIEYEGSEYSHQDSAGNCLTDLEYALKEGTACRLDDDTIVPLDDKYITRDRSRMCLTKADIAESQQLVDAFVAFVGAQADKTWPDKASALVTEYCQSEDKRAMLRTLEHRTTVFDAFDAAYSKGQVYSGLPRHFDEAVYEWCDIMSPSLRDSLPPQNGSTPQVTPTVTP
jgi:hypothetical protein